jgi:hypothetical protein
VCARARKQVMNGPYATPQPTQPFQGDQSYKMPPPPAFMLQNLMQGQYQNRMNVPMSAHSISADQVRRTTYKVRACAWSHLKGGGCRSELIPRREEDYSMIL